MKNTVNDLLRQDDIKDDLIATLDEIDKIQEIIIGFTTTKNQFHWLGTGKRTTLLGLIEAIKYELLRE